MMSEEEKKAVEVLKDYVVRIKKLHFEQTQGFKWLEITLNLLDNQQKELNNLKEIEKSHQEENGKLRVEFEKAYEDNLTLAYELEQEKEKNKELYEALERSSGRVTELTVENSDLKYQLYHKQQMIDELTQSEEKLKIELGKEKERNELFVVSGNSINLERHIKNNYVSKRRIRKKLEYQNMLWNTPNRQKEYNEEFAEFLQELLEGNNE